MRISRVVLNNFRIYKGENEINFHNKNDKNISLIAGKNGFGKTTFLTSLVWVLYGKQMSQVEDKYRTDIKNSGGYEKYLETLVNRDLIQDFLENEKIDVDFCVEINFTNINVPSIICENILIKRSYDYKTKKEELTILIDGVENELTKSIGYEIFINDFILPREIAKFFFFDAEKIVTLAEAKSKSELKTLSKAYSEVLGIKKYEDLKDNLKLLLTKLRRNGVDKVNKEKMDELVNKDEELARLITINEEKQVKATNDFNNIQLEIDNIQEKLIREGSEITLEQLKELNKNKEQLKLEHLDIKNDLKKLMELVPFMITIKRFDCLAKQINIESDAKNKTINHKTLQDEMCKFSEIILSDLNKLKIETDLYDRIYNQIVSTTQNVTVSKEEVDVKIILDYSDESSRKVLETYDFLNNSFKHQFKKIIQDEKIKRTELGNILKKIKQSESRKGNHLVKKLHEDKAELIVKLKNMQNHKESLMEEFGSINIQYNSNKKVLSEYEKSYKLLETDKEKYEVTEKLIDKLDVLIESVKKTKKTTLQNSILSGLNKLMHKDDFINRVDVKIDNDIMDIDLIDYNEMLIDKDTLSKGEQQLYATSLLKALVDESGIDFPIFIDSPLQKFDKEHSKNVIQQFYPSISKQVILFPLLEKELSNSEFNQLRPNLNGVYLIENSNSNSTINEYEQDELFNKFNKQDYVFTN